MARASIRGTPLEYFEEGSGEPLVLVHGSASDHRTWQSQREEFSRRFRVITYSRRYHWPNEPIPQGIDYSMGEQVDDLEGLLQVRGAAPAHLVGHSYGAFLCLLLAIRKPHLVRTLVLEEPPVLTLFVSSAPRASEILRLLLSRPRIAAAILRFGVTGVAPAARAFRRRDTEAGLRTFGDAVFGRGGYDRFPDSQKAQVQANLANIQAELLGSGFAPLAADQLRALEAPALLITGDRSIGLFRHLAEELQELMPHAEKIAIPGASHLMHMYNAPAYNSAVLSFLGRAGRAS